jgi:hypothetical protein
MTAYVKPISVEASANGSGNATTVSSARTVRAVNPGSTGVLVTVTDSAGVTVGTLTLAGQESVLIPKKSTDKVFAGSATVLFAAVTSPR